MVRNPENLESPNPSEQRPRSDQAAVLKALGATAIKGAKQLVAGGQHRSLVSGVS